MPLQVDPPKRTAKPVALAVLATLLLVALAMPRFLRALILTVLIVGGIAAWWLRG